MKLPGVVSLMICMVTPAAAQEPVFLTSSFHLNLNRWQLGQEAANSTTMASVNFTVQSPVLSYRLGAITFTTALDYQRDSGETGSRSALGINRYGFKTNLFPYQPFHVTLEYSHAQNPGLAGFDRVKGDTYGLIFLYRGRPVEDLKFTVRRGSFSQRGATEGWTLWSAAANQHFASTRVNVQLSRQDYRSSESTLRWGGTTMYASSDTNLSKDWEFRTNLSADFYMGSRTLGLSADLSGKTGPATSLTNLSLNQAGSASDQARMVQASQSFMLPKDSYTAFTSVSLATTEASARPNEKRGTLVAGGSYNLGEGWRVSGDLSGSARGGFDPQPSASTVNAGSPSTPTNLITVHAGITKGGDLPALVKHTLFFLSDLNFERRVREEYPPGYVPSELAQEMAMRRFRQGGGIGFSFDLAHTQAGSNTRSQDWARLSGDLRVNTGLRLSAVGDWKRDNEFGRLGKLQDSRAFLFNASYWIGASSNLNVSAGRTRIEERSTTDDAPNPPPTIPGLDPTGRSSASLSVGFNSRLGRIPFGLLWTRWDTGIGLPTRDLNTHAAIDFRQISLRVNYEVAHRADGFRSTRVTVNLLRWFDTLTLWGMPSGW